MVHQLRKAGKDIVAFAVDKREAFLQLRDSIAGLVDLLTGAGARTECLFVLGLNSLLEILDGRILEDKAYGEIYESENCQDESTP
jgi:hypothetical protein